MALSSNISKVVAGLLAGLLAAAVAPTLAQQPVPTRDAPGDLPDFRKAESLYVKSAGFRTGQFDLGYSYYTRGVRGYRLAHSSGINADVQTGYRDAADNAKKADKAWKEAKDEYAQKGTEEGVKACDEMLGYAKSLLDHVNAETAPSKDK